MKCTELTLYSQGNEVFASLFTESAFNLSPLFVNFHFAREMPAPMETPSLYDLATSSHPKTTDHTYRACLKSNFLHGPNEDSNDPEYTCLHHSNHGAASITTIQTCGSTWKLTSSISMKASVSSMCYLRKMQKNPLLQMLKILHQKRK